MRYRLMNLAFILSFCAPSVNAQPTYGDLFPSASADDVGQLVVAKLIGDAIAQLCDSQPALDGLSMTNGCIYLYAPQYTDRVAALDLNECKLTHTITSPEFKQCFSGRVISRLTTP